MLTKMQKEMICQCPNGSFRRSDIMKKYQHCLIGFAPRWGLFDIKLCEDPGNHRIKYYMLNAKGLDVKNQILMELPENILERN